MTEDELAELNRFLWNALHGAQYKQAPKVDYTSEAGFFRLVAAMSKRGWGWSFNEMLEGWEASLGRRQANTSVFGYGDTLPLACAHAARSALEGSQS